MITVNTIQSLAQPLFQKLVDIRRHLHKYPELSFEEHNTSAYIKSVLTAYNIRYTDGWVKTGIVAEIGAENTGPCIALRGDMDALPIAEKNDCEYASTNTGVMHACGHDVHTTCALGAAIVLKQLEPQLSGRVRIVFQPGEEKLPGGASLMLREGALGNPLPDAIIGLHVFPEMDAGKLGFRAGEYMASTDEIYLTITGKGGHAAMRGQYISPLLVAAEVLQALETRFTAKLRKKDTAKPTVLAFGKIEGRGATNVIPDTVSLEGTFRAMDETWRAAAHKLMRAEIAAVCKKHKAKFELNIVKGYPVLHNHEDLTESCMAAAKKLMGARNVSELDLRMTAEDFAYYSQVMPACFFRLGTRNKAKGITSPVHTATFDVDENALLTGVQAMAWLAVNAMEKHSK